MSDVEEEAAPEKEPEEDGSSSDHDAEKADSAPARDAEPDDADKVSEGSGPKSLEEEEEEEESDTAANDSAAEEDVKSAEDGNEPMEVENVSPCPSPAARVADGAAKDSPMEVDEEGKKSEDEETGEKQDGKEPEEEEAEKSPEEEEVEKSPEDHGGKAEATAASADEAEDDAREESAEQSEKDVSESEDEKTKGGSKESGEEDEASCASADKEPDEIRSKETGAEKEEEEEEEEEESKDNEKKDAVKADEETENLDRPKDDEEEEEEEEEEGDDSDQKAEEEEEMESASPIIVRVISTEDDEEDASGNIEISEVKSIAAGKDGGSEGSENEESQTTREEPKKASGKREKGEKASDEKEGKEATDKTKKCKDRRKADDDAEKSDAREEDSDEDGMPTLEIMDVRTVTEEDSPLSSKKDAEDGEAAKEGKGSEASDKDGDQAKGAKEVSDKSDASEKQSEIEAIANKLTKKSKQSTHDNEMKNYAADTMNELLGLFGYEKVDENMKDAIQLSNNLAGPSTEDGKKGSKEKAKEDGEKAAVADDKKSVPETGDADKAKEEKVVKPVVKSGKDAKAASKTPQKRECSFCNKTKPCKYQVLMLGTTKFLCDDNCFREFRTKQHIVTAPAIRDIIAQNRPITRSLMHPKDHCNVCHKEIKNGMGLLPGVGENKPLCSEECMKNYQATQGLKRACAQCGNHIQSRSKCLTWEAMEFCNEECLGKYQSYLGSHCAYCNNAVQQTSLGKYCVRFGSDIKQFCSNGCLEEFKKGLKVCSYCQKDISSGTEGFLAPVGDKGQFKEFCSQSCMEKYETMGSVTPSQPSIEQCSVCNKLTSVKVEVTFENKVHKLCSEPCIAAFRYANKINTSICDTCHKFFDLDVSCQLTIQFEGTSKRFCTKACMNVFVLYHRKVVPCSWCKVKKYNFDMIERVDSNNHVQLFCSLNCLSLFRVSLNATSSKRIQCDFCHQVKPAQYHLTMSDASIRNFCSYNCVMQFQGQFTNVAPVVAATTTAPTPQVAITRTTATTTTTSVQSGTPIISSVMSLAPSQPTPQLTKAISIRPTTAPVLTKIHKVMGTQTMAPTITQQVVIKQAPVKPQKNKMLMCRPMTQTKGVSCKPHPCHKSSQTDGEYREHPVIVPIPVPFFVPVPMRMYSTPVPFPVAFPLPIPVPIFIPTTKDSAQGIFKQIKEIQQKIPNNPFEADLILMAEMVAEDSSATKGKTKALMSKLGSKGLDGEQSSSNDGSSEKQEGFVVETSMPDSCPPANTFGDEVLQMALRMASSMEQPGDLENVLSNQSPDLNSTGEENGSYVSARELRGQARNNNKRSSSRPRGRGRKRARLDDVLDREPDSPSPAVPTPHTPPVATQFDFRPIGAPQLESNCVLKFSYGVNAWKHWVLQKNTQLEKASQTNRKLKLFKTDILQLSADELNYSLCLFIKEVRKPNGDEYAPDSIYYLCLGIQQYLFENGRIDNIFSDAYYEKFTECLNEVLQRYEATLTSDGCFLSRIEEEILWECKQLGAHSPHVLLNTLMYFNTKFFMLKSIDDHLQLSFSHILKHWKKTPGSTAKGSPGGRNVLLRYYPPSQVKADSPRRRKETIPSYEQVENLDNPLRCPVKLYEFYLSKCPESIKNRNDIFYLYPERSCVPDSPVWYSTMSLGKETIAKMLQRIRMVREVGDNITTT